MKAACTATLLVVLVFGLTPVMADPVTFFFDGQFAQQQGFSDPLIDFSGATISGYYTFLSNTLDSNVADTTIGDYQNALTYLTATVTWSGGSFTVEALHGNILVWANYVDGSGSPPGGEDKYVVRGTGGFTDNLHGYSISGFQLIMGPVPGDEGPFSTDALPTTPPFFGNPRVLEFFGVDNTLKFDLITRVPEPGTLMLLGLGLAGLGLGLRRRRQ